MNIFDVLGENGERWIKGAPHRYTENGSLYCLWGANASLTWKESGISFRERILDQIAFLLFPERISKSGQMVATAQVNDHPNTTWEDIKLIIKHVEAEEDRLNREGSW